MSSHSGRRSFRSSSDSFFRPPTAPEIAEHARYLGLDPVYDSHLMWMAEESLCAPLPAFWDDHVDEHGRVFYRNRRTGQTSRCHPLDKKYKKKVLQAKMCELQRTLVKMTDEAVRAANGELGWWGSYIKAVEDLIFTVHDFLRDSLGVPF